MVLIQRGGPGPGFFRAKSRLPLELLMVLPWGDCGDFRRDLFGRTVRAREFLQKNAPIQGWPQILNLNETQI